MKLIVGLDLSFNSTGICLSHLSEDNIAEKISFYRIVFDDESRKGVYVPKSVKNINTRIYRLPHYLTPEVLCIDDSDENNKDQIETTLRAMCASKEIFGAFHDFYQSHPCDFIIVSIENYIMPSFGGQNSLKNVSGLIALQAFIRELFLRFCNKNRIRIKMLTPSPTTLKKFFTDNGKAEKEDMLKYFQERFDGHKLLPNSGPETLKIINDVVDAFALNIYAYGKLLNYTTEEF